MAGSHNKILNLRDQAFVTLSVSSRDVNVRRRNNNTLPVQILTLLLLTQMSYLVEGEFLGVSPMRPARIVDSRGLIADRPNLLPKELRNFRVLEFPDLGADLLREVSLFGNRILVDAVRDLCGSASVPPKNPSQTIPNTSARFRVGHLFRHGDRS